MTDSPAHLPGASEPEPGNAQPAPSDSSGSTPLGSARQYGRAPRLPGFNNLVSITGGTRDDPAGELSRAPVLCDPEWASPLKMIWAVFVRGYIFSFLIYWLGYGFSLMLSLGVAQWLFGHEHQLPGSLLGGAFFTGPLYGFILDHVILHSNSPVALIGGLMLVTEPLLAFLILITFEWPARLRYCCLMFGLVLLKAVLYVLVGSAN
jgi:hypothetical protein